LAENGTELYNLDEDPAETANLAEQHPEICERMTDRIDEWVKTLPAKVNRKRKNARRE
jgi:hypothetical protein